MLNIEGQLAFIKLNLFGQFILHQEPVLDQTLIYLQHNTISLKFLDFLSHFIPNMTCLNCLIFDDALYNYARREIITSDFTTSYLVT